MQLAAGRATRTPAVVLSEDRAELKLRRYCPWPPRACSGTPLQGHPPFLLPAAGAGVEGAEERFDVGAVGAEGDDVDAGRGQHAAAAVGGVTGSLGVGLSRAAVGGVDERAGTGLGVLHLEQADVGQLFFARVGEGEGDDLVTESGGAELFLVAGVEEVGDEEDDGAAAGDAGEVGQGRCAANGAENAGRFIAVR